MGHNILSNAMLAEAHSHQYEQYHPFAYSKRGTVKAYCKQPNVAQSEVIFHRRHLTWTYVGLQIASTSIIP